MKIRAPLLVATGFLTSAAYILTGTGGAVQQTGQAPPYKSWTSLHAIKSQFEQNKITFHPLPKEVQFDDEFWSGKNYYKKTHGPGSRVQRLMGCRLQVGETSYNFKVDKWKLPFTFGLVSQKRYVMETPDYHATYSTEWLSGYQRLFTQEGIRNFSHVPGPKIDILEADNDPGFTRLNQVKLFFRQLEKQAKQNQPCSST